MGRGILRRHHEGLKRGQGEGRQGVEETWMVRPDLAFRMRPRFTRGLSSCTSSRLGLDRAKAKSKAVAKKQNTAEHLSPSVSGQMKLRRKQNGVYATRAQKQGVEGRPACTGGDQTTDGFAQGIPACRGRCSVDWGAHRPTMHPVGGDWPA